MNKNKNKNKLKMIEQKTKHNYNRSGNRKNQIGITLNTKEIIGNIMR